MASDTDVHRVITRVVLSAICYTLSDIHIQVCALNLTSPDGLVYVAWNISEHPPVIWMHHHTQHLAHYGRIPYRPSL